MCAIFVFAGAIVGFFAAALCAAAKRADLEIENEWLRQEFKKLRDEKGVEETVWNEMPGEETTKEEQGEAIKGLKNRLLHPCPMS